MKKGTHSLMLVLLGIFSIIGLVSCTSDGTVTPTSQPPQEEYDIKTDPSGVKYIVDTDKIVGGGPPKDGIPSIDNPKFVTLDEADQWIADNELVLGITYKGVKRR